MKKFLFLLTAISVVVSMWAAPVDQATAAQKARNYLANEMYFGKLMAPDALNPVLIKTEYGTGNSKSPVYYIFNTSTTYLVMSADDRAEEILMIGDTPLDMSRIPDALQYLLDCYTEQLSFLIDNPGIKVERASDAPRLRAETYGPLLTAMWDQEAPYYNQCRFTRNGTTYQCLTGCPATSAAMVMYYWKYPPSIGALASYTGYLDIGTYSSNLVSFTYPALEATTFDWANMKDSYAGSSTTAQKTAVATLMRYIGQAEKMMYGGVNVGSGISSANSQIIATMFKNWGYKSSARLVNKSSYSSDDAWANVIIAEMAASRPVVYLGIDPDDGGHAFNVDGYRDSDSKYHVNFGWSGYGNNWYAMNAFTYQGSTFSQNQQAIVGIESPYGLPDNPYFEVGATSLTFTAEVGETKTQTFTVSGGNLTNNINLSLTGNAAFSISPTTITPAQAAAGATVTVTYAPTAAGTQSAAIGVSCEGLTSKTVTLSGTSTGGGTTPGDPTLNVNPSSLTFNTEAGTPVTQTFVVTGSNLTASVVTLSCSGEGFSINKTQISRSAVQSASGSTVTVTYSPTASGNHTGTVTINSTGAESKTVTLNGTATAAPTITVDPTSLSFTTQVGTPVTKTFTVTGTDLTGNVSLAVDGTGFAIDKTTINKNAAANGATVTVTYNPTAGGTHTGTVTLTSAGAATKTVTLTGTASTTPSLTANPTSLTMSTVVGTPVTKTFVVTGTNLTSNVVLAVNGAGFAIDKNSLTVNEATGGATVTVTYNPTAAGTHTGSIIIASTGAQTISVSLNGTATEPVRTITADPTALNFNTLVGQTITKTFTVTGENLTGALSVVVNNGNGIYSVEPSTITVAEATAGKTVTVTYSPTAFGITNASVTISGGGAPAATVTLAGQADLVKYAPVMLPANEDYIGLTKFRADWTDESPAISVESYTLEVTPKAVEPAEPVLLHSLSGSAYSGNGYNDITLSAPWAGVSVRGGYGAIYIKNNYNGVAQGYITYTIPEGYTNATFTVMVTSANTDNGVSDLTISTPQTPAVSHNFVKNETFYWVVTASSGEKITIISNDQNYSPDMTLIAVYSGDATASTLRATETGDENSRLITGITDKFYTVENLAAEGTFLYRVKALYFDGTESEWSNIEEVTLFDNTPAFVRGDVDGNNVVDMDDLTALINYLLDGTSSINTPGAASCSDADDTTLVDMDDLTGLINYLLSGQW